MHRLTLACLACGFAGQLALGAAGDKAIGVASVTQQVAKGRSWALLIGVDKYLNVGRLRYCGADARLLARVLTTRCGFEPQRVLVIADDQTDPGNLPFRSNLVVKIPAWLKLARPDDRVIVMFSGHGFLDPRGRMYLAPLDCDPDNLPLTGLAVDHLRDYLSNCKARVKLLILDTCHSGAAKGGKAIGVEAETIGRALQQAGQDGGQTYTIHCTLAPAEGGRAARNRGRPREVAEGSGLH